MPSNELERQLRWLMILRLVTVTTLLISAFAIELALKPGQTVRPLFFLTAGAYGLVLLYAGRRSSSTCSSSATRPSSRPS